MSRLGQLIARLQRVIGRFGRANDAVAAVEFALVLPLMLTMYVGASELSQLINIDQRVTVIAGTTGDLVSREKGEVTADDLTDYFQAATAILSPFSTGSLKQTVTLVAVDPTTGKVTVKWSQGYNGGRTFSTGDFPVSHTLPAQMVSLVQSASVPYMVISEASYSFTPLLGLFFNHSFLLYHQSFYLPRYPAIICYNTATCS
jgi:Flp pilus assembly protein TadG